DQQRLIELRGALRSAVVRVLTPGHIQHWQNGQNQVFGTRKRESVICAAAHLHGFYRFERGSATSYCVRSIVDIHQFLDKYWHTDPRNDRRGNDNAMSTFTSEAKIPDPGPWGPRPRAGHPRPHARSSRCRDRPP